MAGMAEAVSIGQPKFFQSVSSPNHLIKRTVSIFSTLINMPIYRRHGTARKPQRVGFSQTRPRDVRSGEHCRGTDNTRRISIAMNMLNNSVPVRRTTPRRSVEIPFRLTFPTQAALHSALGVCNDEVSGQDTEGSENLAVRASRVRYSRIGRPVSAVRDGRRPGER